MYQFHSPCCLYYRRFKALFITENYCLWFKWFLWPGNIPSFVYIMEIKINSNYIENRKEEIASSYWSWHNISATWLFINQSWGVVLGRCFICTLHFFKVFLQAPLMINATGMYRIFFLLMHNNVYSLMTVNKK